MCGLLSSLFCEPLLAYGTRWLVSVIRIVDYTSADGTGERVWSLVPLNLGVDEVRWPCVTLWHGCVEILIFVLLYPLSFSKINPVRVGHRYG